MCERPKLTAVGLNLARKRRIRWGGAKTPEWNRFEQPRHNHLSRLPNVSDSDALGQQEPIILPVFESAHSSATGLDERERACLCRAILWATWISRRRSHSPRLA